MKQSSIFYHLVLFVFGLLSFSTQRHAQFKQTTFISLADGTILEYEMLDTTKDWYGVSFKNEQMVITPFKFDSVVLVPHEMENYFQFTNTSPLPDYLFQSDTVPVYNTVASVNFAPSELYPGQRIVIDYNNERYVLMAFGDGVRHSRQIGYEGVGNYNLRLMKGDSPALSIIKVPYFDDNFIRIKWIGDFNQDGALDFLLQTSPKYSNYVYELFILQTN